MIEMIWRARDPAAIHPARREIDLARREAFAGFRPPLRVEQRAGYAIQVVLRARVTAPVIDDRPVYQGYTRAQLAAQMSPRAQVPDMSAVFAKWTADGAEARAGLPGGLDIAYGPHRDQILDLYRPSGATRSPVWVFIHGGYWQASSKDQHAQFCTGMVEAGFAVANIDYGLAPETPLACIVEQVRAALWFLFARRTPWALTPHSCMSAGIPRGGIWRPSWRAIRFARRWLPRIHFPACCFLNR